MNMSDPGLSDPLLDDTPDPDPRDWARWLPEPIRQPGTPAQQPAAPAQADPSPVPAKEPEQLVRDALARVRTKAQEKGYSDGYSQGLDQGLADGHKKGYQAGYEAGYTTGHDDGSRAAEQAAENLAALSRQCAHAITDLEADIGQALITLSIRIAEQVLHRTLDTEPQSILALVNQILQVNAGTSTALQLHVNPQDLELVHSYLHDNPDTRMWRVLPDDSITRGGCTARTALGDIDATLETRWQRVVSAIGGNP